MGKVSSEKDYLALLDRIIKGAYYLADPNIAPEAYEKALRLYDSLCEQARKMRWGDENAQIHRHTTKGR